MPKPRMLLSLRYRFVVSLFGLLFAHNSSRHYLNELDSSFICRFIHRRNSNCKWSVACYDGERLCGVAIAGQPVARKLDDGLTIEIRRVCTDGTRNACMKAIVKRLLDDGKSVQEIGRQLGMRPEEVFRLSDFSRDDFLAMMTKGVKGYSHAELLTKL